MFVGEAPGYHEDQQGRPFVGAAGKLLGELLASIGLSREQVFIANVLKDRPPNNRDPRPEEISACEPWLWQQIALIRPSVICSLGNFATKLLSGDPTGITRVHGRPQLHVLGGQSVYLYPIFHPAAALYTPAMLATLKQDFLRLPDLLASPPAGWRDPTTGELSAASLAPAAPAPATDPPENPRSGPTGDPGLAAEIGSTAEIESADERGPEPDVPPDDRPDDRPVETPAPSEQLGLF
jgi:DNA polymerase